MLVAVVALAVAIIFAAFMWLVILTSIEAEKVREKRGAFGPTPRPFGKRRRLSHDDMEAALQRISPRAWADDEVVTRVTRRRR